ncbi:MAG: hypothetical protein M3R51_04325 [Candidatus Eremiobacteraeota bacterium]|nr:hypothetical protein [Candidatus Eremiobacteraeota bacterium]
MIAIARFRSLFFAGALVADMVLVSAPAPASIDLVVGSRTVVANAPIADCNTKAKGALTAVLHYAFDVKPGTGQWFAYGPRDADGKSSAAAAVQCYPVNTGYVVTFTCSAEVPPSPDTASVLCTKLTAAFGSGASAAPSQKL